MAETTQEIKPFAAIDNRYVPGGSYATALYETTYSPERLTFGQLVSAVSLRLGAANEARAILSMNRLVNNISFSTLLASVVKKLTEEPNKDRPLTWDSNVWDLVGDVMKRSEYVCRSKAFDKTPTLENFLTGECGVVLSAGLPVDDGTTRDLNKVKSRLDAYSLFRPVMEDVTRMSELLQVDVETDIGRRDVVITAASNVIKSFMSTMMAAVQAMK